MTPCRPAFVIAALLSTSTLSHSEPVDYTKQIAPLLENYCVDCHGADDPDGEFVTETYTALMKGGKEGLAIKPGNSSESMLVKFLEGHSGRG